MSVEQWVPAVIMLAIVFLGAAGTFYYLWRMQARVIEAARESIDLTLMADKPLGLPSGTVRSVLALFIVFAGVAFLAISVLPTGGTFPDVMSGILGTVLGFYFGSRSASGTQAKEVLDEVNAVRRQRDEAVRETSEGKLQTITGKVRDGVGLARLVAKMLPGDLGKRFDRVADVVAGGLAVVDKLRGEGKSDEALAKAGELVAEFRRESPVRNLLQQAVGSFGKVLGTAVPPLAIATAVVGIGSRLAGAAYDRWVARVLHAPYTPELFPPTVIDANTAISLLRRSSIFGRAYAPELEAGNRRFLSELPQLALSEDRVEELWQQTRDRFEDREQFDDGLAQIQRAAMEIEATKDVADEELPEIGRVDELLAAVDQLHADPEAQRDLDAIVLIADEIKRSGRSPEEVFAVARAELEEET